MPQTDVQKLAGELLRLSVEVQSGTAPSGIEEAYGQTIEAFLSSEPENSTDALALAWFDAGLRCGLRQRLDLLWRAGKGEIREIRNIGGRIFRRFKSRAGFVEVPTITRSI